MQACVYGWTEEDAARAGLPHAQCTDWKLSSNGGHEHLNRRRSRVCVYHEKMVTEFINTDREKQGLPPVCWCHGEPRQPQGRGCAVKQRASQAEWRKKNPDKVFNKNMLARGYQGGDYTRSEVMAMTSYFCAYCKEAAAEVVEHVIPLSRGGENRRENVVPACRSCNSKKGRHGFDWVVDRWPHFEMWWLENHLC